MLEKRVTSCFAFGPQHTWYSAFGVVVIDLNAFEMESYLIFLINPLICQCLVQCLIYLE